MMSASTASHPKHHGRRRTKSPQRPTSTARSQLPLYNSALSSTSSKRVRQRAIRCGILAGVFGMCQLVTQNLQSKLAPSPCHSTRQLSTALSSYGSYSMSMGGGPPTPEEFLGMSFEAKSNRNKLASTSSSSSQLLLPIPRSSTRRQQRPTFVLYAGVPEHSIELQCRICSNSKLRDALDKDGYVFLGTCPKYGCEEYESPSASASSTNATTSQATTDSDENTRVFSPHPSNFFTSPTVFEYTSYNTTLKILPHTHAMSLAHGRRRNIPQLEVDFMLTLDRLRSEHRNAVLIHPGACKWSARHIRSLSAFLHLHWDVHVLVGPYQPFLEYVSEISYNVVQMEYMESRTFRLWPDQKRGNRVGFDRLDESTINYVKDLVEENLVHGMHPLEMAWSNYARHFGTDRTHFVIPALPTATNMSDKIENQPTTALAQAHLLEHLICDVLGLTRSCRIVQEAQQRERLQQLSQGIQEQDDPTSRWTRQLTEIWELIQVDAVAVAAHDRYMASIQASSSNSTVDRSRAGVRGRIWAHLDNLGETPLKDWPRVCLELDAVEALTDYSTMLHDRILRKYYREGQGTTNQTNSSTYSPRTEWFVTDVLLCHVDTSAVLNDEKWAAWFQEIWQSDSGGAVVIDVEGDDRDSNRGTSPPAKGDGGAGVVAAGRR